MGVIWKVLTRKKYIDPSELERTDLARVLNTFDLTALGVGSTLGVGVYVIVGHVAREVAGPSVVLSFLIAAVASIFAGLCYAEFGSRVPKAGSAYVYSYVCVGEFIAFIIGWNLILEYVIGSASVAKGLSLYLDTMLNDTLKDTFREIAPIDVNFMGSYFDFFSFGLSVILAVALSFGIKESSLVNNLFTTINIAVVIFVIIVGGIHSNPDNWRLPGNGTAPAYNGGFFPFGVSGMITGAATCFYGFIGFDCIATSGEEVKNPKRAVPIAIITSLAIIFFAYFGTSTVVTMMIPYFEQDEGAPIPHAFEALGVYFAKWVVAIGGIFGLLASLFGAMFPLPRIIYAMANDGIIFRFLGIVNRRFSSPIIGTLLAGLLTGLMSALFDLRHLVNMMSIGTLLAYTIVAACVLLLRYNTEGSDVHYSLLRSNSDSDLESYTDTPGIEDANMSSQSQLPENRKPSAWTVLKQMSNGGASSTPSYFSEKLVAIYVCVYCLLCLFMGLCIVFLADEIQLGKIYAIILTSIVGFLMIIVLMSLSVQPKSNAALSFMVPFVPLIPALSIMVNIYLMLMLDANTWIRFGIWMAVGIPIYIYCVHTCSMTKKTSSVTNLQQLEDPIPLDKNTTNVNTDDSFAKYDKSEENYQQSIRSHRLTITMEESESENNLGKTSDYGSFKSLEANTEDVAKDELKIKKSITSVEEEALAVLDDVLAAQSSNDLYGSRKSSFSTASNLPIEENTVALIHREDPDTIIENKSEIILPNDKLATTGFDQNEMLPEGVESEFNKIADESEKMINNDVENELDQNVPNASQAVEDNFNDDLKDFDFKLDDDEQTSSQTTDSVVENQNNIETAQVVDDVGTDLKIIHTPSNNEDEIIENKAEQLTSMSNNDDNVGCDEKSETTVNPDEQLKVESFNVPIPPPLEDFQIYKETPILLKNDTNGLGRTNGLFIKQKAPSPPSPSISTPTTASRRSSIKSSSELQALDDNVKMGSKQHQVIADRLVTLFSNNLPGMIPQKALRKSKPIETEEENLPKKSVSYLPAMSQVIAEIAKTKTPVDFDDDDKGGSKEPAGNRNSDGGVDDTPIQRADIRSKLNELLRQSVRPAKTVNDDGDKSYRPFDTVKRKVDNGNDASELTENKEIQFEHKKKMNNALATIRLRKVDSFKE